MKVPSRITPCPIIDSVLELRFISELPDNAVFGIVYNEFSKLFPVVQNLPILEIPGQLRANDPNLKFAPYYQMIGEHFWLLVGPRVFSISNPINYVGWQGYSSIIYQAIQKFNTLKIASSILRLGLRYTNFFQDVNIFDKINLHINFNSHLVTNKNSFFKSEITVDGFIHNIQILNSANIQKANQPAAISGSIIDIDTNSNLELDQFFIDPNRFIEKAHQLEKELFYQIITESFLKTNFKVEY